jgi:hypothetical protein
MVFDLFCNVPLEPGVADRLEAQEPPPDSLTHPDEKAIYWILAFATEWRSILFTCSDVGFEELAAMKPDKTEYARRLLDWGLEMRENHPEEYRKVDRNAAPSGEELESLGLKPADALHVADAIRIAADYFLTRDKRVLRKATDIWRRWRLRVATPAQFLNGIAPFLKTQ